MNTPQFSSASWIVDDMADISVMIEGLQNGDWIAVEAPEKGGHVAYCHPMNAPLIAAAPELFEALVECHKSLLSHYTDGHGYLLDSKRLDVASKAIAKALGQSA